MVHNDTYHYLLRIIKEKDREIVKLKRARKERDHYKRMVNNERKRAVEKINGT